MLFRSRLATTGVTVLAGAVLGLAALASPAAASTQPQPSLDASPSAAGAPTTPATITADAAKRKKKDPCVADAALDAESGRWRATVSCDDWTAVLPGTYDTRQEALGNAEGWTRGINGKVMDGPGCNPPFVFC